MRIAIVQSDAVLGDIPANLARHRDAVARAGKKGARLVLFPELSLSGYLLEDRARESALSSRELTALFDDAAPDDTVIGVGFPERTRTAVYNAYALLRGGKKAQLIGVQRKVNLPTYGMFDESRHFRAGTTLTRFTISETVSAAVLICEDAWHPALPVTFAQEPEGVPHLFIVPAASPSRGYRGKRPSNLAGWEHIAEHFSRVYGVAVLMPQRVGVEDSLIFAGGSLTVDHHGFESRAPLFREAMLTVEVDTALITRTLSKTAVVSPLDRDILKKSLI